MANKARVGIVARRARASGPRPRRAASSELLGIDPLLVANEGKAVIGVRPRASAEPCSRRSAPIRSAATPRSSAPARGDRPGSVDPRHRLRPPAPRRARGRAAATHMLTRQTRSRRRALLASRTRPAGAARDRCGPWLDLRGRVRDHERGDIRRNRSGRAPPAPPSCATRSPRSLPPAVVGLGDVRRGGPFDRETAVMLARSRPTW